MIAFFIGAAVMALGGIVELFYGVKAEGKQREDIAQPLTVADADAPDLDGEGKYGARGEEPGEGLASMESDEGRASEERIRARLDRRRERECAGLRRYRPGPGGSPGARVPAAASFAPEQPLDDHIEASTRAGRARRRRAPRARYARRCTLLGPRGV